MNPEENNQTPIQPIQPTQNTPPQPEINMTQPITPPSSPDMNPMMPPNPMSTPDPMPLNTMPMNEPPHEGGKIGPIIGIIIIILIIIVGGLYIWGQQLVRNDTDEPNYPTEGSSLNDEVSPIESTPQTTPQNTEEDFGRIESDLNTSNPDNLDSDFSDLEAEFSQ